jgi:hypothetical protein
VKIRLTIPFIFLLLISTITRADDAGIAEVRLIEEEKNIYSLEVDVPPSLLSTIQRPILPKRCTFIGNWELVPVGPMRVVRYRFTSGDTPLQPDEELLLYWQRSGVVLTVYWLDGSSHRVYFDRELAGIRIPINRLREVKITKALLISRGFADAGMHLGKMWFMHLLLVVACTILGSPKRMAQLLLTFAAGHGFSLVATDLGFSFVPPDNGTMMMAVASLLMLIATVYDRWQPLRFWPVLLVLGLLHGLGYTNPSFEQPLNLSTLQLITARLAFNTIIDLFHAFSGTVIWAIIIVGTRSNLAQRYRQNAVYLAGGLAVAATLTLIPDALVPSTSVGKTISPPSAATSGSGSSTRAPSRPMELSDPMLGFVTVTPFEIRCEWLMSVSDLNAPAVNSESGEMVLPIDAQAAFKEELMKRLTTETMVDVDGERIEPSLVRADFVSVGNYGVTTRPSPIAEPLDKAVIGLTIAYVVDKAPSEVSLRLIPYPKSISSIPITFTDPWGSTPHELTREFPQANWNRRMAGFRRPVIRAVTIQPVTWPILSVVMLVLAAVILFLIRRGWRERLGYAVISMSFVIAMGTYPFVRAAVPPVLTRSVPADEEMSKTLNQMLTNIYRAFDYRTEEAIYDRLAVSATGDQLASIYLQHRSAMEIENRGGARASVDNVEVLEISEVTPSVDGLSLDASWIVSGSVNHFGHIHYRKNQYKATVHITAYEGVWKINGIDVEEEERIL